MHQRTKKMMLKKALPHEELRSVWAARLRFLRATMGRSKGEMTKSVPKPVRALPTKCVGGMWRSTGRKAEKERPIIVADKMV